SDLEAMNRLHRIGSLLIAEHTQQTVLDEIVDSAVAIAGADMGSLQIFDGKRDGRKDGLRMAAQRGLAPPLLEALDKDGTAAAVAKQACSERVPVHIEDISRSPLFADAPTLEAHARAGVRAMRATPMVSRDGRMVGVLSTHFRAVRRADPHSLRLLELL